MGEQHAVDGDHWSTHWFKDVPIFGLFKSEYYGGGLLDSRTEWNYWNGSNFNTVSANDFNVKCSAETGEILLQCMLEAREKTS